MSKKKKEDGEPIRILQYIGSLETGGSQSMIMNIYRNIDRNKIQFDFVVDRKGEGDLFYKDEIEKLGGKVYVFNEHFKGYNYLGFTKQWKEFFRAHPEYKVIHCHVRSVASIVLRIAKKNGLKTICHSHSTSNGRGVKSVAKKYLQGRIGKYCDYYLACSEKSAEWLYGKEVLKSKRCLIINNAIDISKYKYNAKIRKKVRTELGLNGEIVLGQVGRLESVKNHAFSLRLLSELLENGGGYHLLIVGKGTQKDDIIKQAKEIGVYKNITILENRNDVNELMQAMDVFIMPSLYEGLPLALVEAQAASLPCVISDTIRDGILVKEKVTRLSLDTLGKWVKTIEGLDISAEARKDISVIITEGGFNITENVKTISDFYLDLDCDKRLKIAFCLGSMRRGGAERVVANLSNCFIKNNDVMIIVTRPGEAEYALNEGIGYYTLDDGLNKERFLKRTFRRVGTLRKILKKESPDIVVSFLPEPSFRLMMAKSFLPVRTIISVRNDPNREYNSFIKRLLVKVLYVRADGFVFQTPDAKKWFSEKIQNKSIVIPNPIDKNFLCKPYDGEREKRIVTVGRLVEQKNQKLLIDAFCEFYKKHNDYILEIYGSGPLGNELQRHIDGLGLNGIAKLMGEVSDVKKAIYKAKMFVLTSDYEGMPNALMEAMALGVPCISTDCPIGGPRFLIKNGENGILVTKGSVKQMALGMCKVVEDEVFREKISRNAKELRSRLNPEKIYGQWLNYIERAVE